MAVTHRERVRMALNHEQPDRVPVDMMGNATMLLDKTYLCLRDYLGLSPIPPIRSGSSANYYDERVLEALGVDFRRVYLKKGPRNKTEFYEDGTFRDVWNIRYQTDGLFVNAIEHPLQKADTVADVEAYPWPTAEDLFSAAGIEETTRILYETSDYALVARNPLSNGFLDHSCALMGMAEFMILMGTNPEVADAVIKHQLEIKKGVYRMFLEAVGKYVEVVEIGDDLGAQNSLLISPAMFRRFIKPAMTELYGMMHEIAPNVKIIHHTDGNLWKIIPDLIETGINILNPVQTTAKDMEGPRLKAAFGQQLCFHGGIEKMEHSKDELVAEVKQRISELGVGGGYVMASCNHMIDVPPENILAMFETAREFKF